LTYYLYHIAVDGAGLDQGYIGITKYPKSRWSRHKSKNSDSNPILKRAIKKYKPSFNIIAVFDTLEDALWQEFTLRPFDRMGWNLVKGGGLPPSMGGWNKGKKTPEDVRKKQSEVRKGRFKGEKHPRSKLVTIYDYQTDEVLYKNVVISPWAKQNGYNPSHLTDTAKGKTKHHKGIYARYVE